MLLRLRHRPLQALLQLQILIQILKQLVLRELKYWELVYQEEYKLKTEAMSREKQIKSWKSRKLPLPYYVPLQPLLSGESKTRVSRCITWKASLGKPEFWQNGVELLA